MSQRALLDQQEHAFVVSAAKYLLDALNVRDPMYVLFAYERIQDIALKEKERQKREERGE